MVKAYTDFEQSCKLSEILPHESADLVWSRASEEDSWIVELAPYSAVVCPSWIDKSKFIIPCWSLAALFDTLPKTICSYSKMMGYFNNAYHCYYLYEDCEGIGVCTTADNLIDAVYDMVLIQNKPK